MWGQTRSIWTKRNARYTKYNEISSHGRGRFHQLFIPYTRICRIIACVKLLVAFKIACNKTFETKFISFKRYSETIFSLNLSQQTMNVSARLPVTNYIHQMLVTWSQLEMLSGRQWRFKILLRKWKPPNNKWNIPYSTRQNTWNNIQNTKDRPNKTQKIHRSFLLSARYTVFESN